MKKLNLVGINHVCIKCGEEKDLSEFVKRNDIKRGYLETCLVCKRKRRRELYPNNKKTVLKYYYDRKDSLNENNKQWVKKNKKRRKKWEKEYYEANKELIIESRRNNPKLKLYRKKYLIENRDRVNKLANERNKRNPHRVAYRNALKNTIYRMNGTKNDLTIRILGYSSIEFKQHIESLFIDNMSWSNYGKGNEKWEVDHIIPVSAFKKNTPIRIVNSLLNLRPLWWIDNYIKKHKIIIEIIAQNKELFSIFKKYCYKKIQCLY